MRFEFYQIFDLEYSFLLEIFYSAALVIKSLRLQAIFFICSWLNSYLLSCFNSLFIDSNSWTNYCLNSIQFAFYILKDALKELCTNSVSSIIIKNWIISWSDFEYLFSFIYQLIISAENSSVVKTKLRVKVNYLFIIFLVKVSISDVFINSHWFLLSQIINISEFFTCKILEFHYKWCAFKSLYSKVLCDAFI